MLGAIIGSAIGAGASLLGNKMNTDMQKDFAQKGIQWKVRDSLKAGIHPLFGLGANTVSFSPTNVGGELASTFSQMGQDIDRSRMATTEAGPRGVIGKLALERASLENDLLRAQIASTMVRTSAPHVGPAAPGMGMPDVLALNPESQDVANRYDDAVSTVYGGMKFIRDYDRHLKVQNKSLPYTRFWGADAKRPPKNTW